MSAEEQNPASKVDLRLSNTMRVMLENSGERERAKRLPEPTIAEKAAAAVDAFIDTFSTKELFYSPQTLIAICIARTL